MIKKQIKAFLAHHPVLYEALKQVYKKSEISSDRQLAMQIRRENRLENSPIDLDKKSELCLLAIARGEDPYFIEWIEFHKTMGVDHFFIYDNEESTRVLLEPYIQRNELTLIPFPDLIKLRDTNNNQGLIQ